MTFRSPHLRLLTATTLLLAGSVTLAAGSPATEAKRAYEQERTACMSGQSQQDRSTCLREASAAWAEARRGGLTSATSTDYQANALARCNAQPAADRDACVLRIQGQGRVEGSGNGGGVIRQVETPIK